MFVIACAHPKCSLMSTEVNNLQFTPHPGLWCRIRMI